MSEDNKNVIDITSKRSSKDKIHFGPEELKELVRFEWNQDYFNNDNSDDNLYERLVISGSYRPTFHDLVTACRNMLDKEIDYDGYLIWQYLVFEEIAEYYGCWEQGGVDNAFWPKSEDDLLRAMKSILDEISYNDESDDVDGDMIEGLNEVILEAENFEYNKNHDMHEWKLSEYQIRRILEGFVERSDKVPNSRKDLFRSIVESECEKENTEALYIKGYGCYGGDEIFECDWNESKKLITKLFELTEEPQYANTLGYIYYYGRCNGGVPEYEKAFQYFSVGAVHGLLESVYKQADMFLAGKGCIKAPKTAELIIWNLYREVRTRFCHGEDAKFADIALRMAAADERHGDFEAAYSYYLEADYAIKKRLQKSTFFGDKTVQDKIAKSIAEVKSKLPDDYFKDEIVKDFPFWIGAMLYDKCMSKVDITKVGDNRYKIRVEREKKEHPGKALVVIPELETAMRTRIIESEFVTDVPVEYKKGKGEAIYIDNIDYNIDEDGAALVEFRKGDEVRLAIKKAEYVLNKQDLEKK